MEQRIINKVALAVFKDRKMIMVKTQTSGDSYYTLGGKIEEGESDLDCLIREVKEEVDTQVDTESIEFLASFETEAHNKENTVLRIKLYTGKLLGEPKPSSEILEVDFLDYERGMANPPVLSKLIFPWLKSNGYID